MSTGLTEAEKIQRLPWLVGGDAFNIMFVLLTFSGSVFVLSLDELNLTSAQIGFLLAQGDRPRPDPRQIQHLLTSDELIEALGDPSYSVRYEAIHSIGRMPSTPELREALIEILEGPQSELGMATARALGRFGDLAAIPALRCALRSGYDLIATESARALAQLDDQASIPDLAERMRAEPSRQLKVTYASALGKLRVRETIPELFRLLCEAETDTERGELGLAVARMVGEEKYYLQQWRSLHSNFDTAAAQAVLALRRPVRRAGYHAVDAIVEDCAGCFAAGNTVEGADHLQEVLRALAADQAEGAIHDVLLGSADALLDFGATRPDLILLALHVIDTTLATRMGHS